MREKKVRGKKRKTCNLIKRIKEYTSEFPTEFYNCYWHLRLPADKGFINSNKVPAKIKRLIIQSLLDRAAYLVKLKPDDGRQYRVVAAVSIPDFWRSEILVFRGNGYFDDFFNRNNDYIKWLPLSDKRNIQTEWGLSVSEGLLISGY